MVWLLSGWCVFIAAWLYFGYERFISQSEKEPSGGSILFGIQIIGLILIFVLNQFPMFFVTSLAAAFFVRTHFSKTLI